MFYNQYAGPNNQPLTNEINSFDQWLGHPTGQSAYHYHIEPLYLTQQYGEDSFWVYWLMVFLCMDQLKMEKKSQIIILILITVIQHVTDDFPDGIYHYHITDEDPYINGNGFYGNQGTFQTKIYFCFLIMFLATCQNINIEYFIKNEIKTELRNGVLFLNNKPF